VASQKAKDDASTPLHPTAQRLLDTAVDLLENRHMDDVSLAMVLERSGVSHGSLYHHFDDFPKLVEQAVVVRFELGLKEALRGVASLAECHDVDDFRRSTEQLFVRLNEQERRPFRLYRVQVIGGLQSHPRLAAEVGRAQQQFISDQCEYFREFQQRGWLRADVDPLALSTYVTALFVGRTVDDIVPQPVDPALWTDVALRAVRAVLFSD